MHRGIVTALIIACLLATSLVVGFAAPDKGSPEHAVTQFMKAYILKDRDITPYVPEEDKNLFGPYPFTGQIEYSSPKVDENQALVEFKAPVGDSRYPRKGAVLLRKYKDVWYVRQVLFYDHIPRVFGLPSKSKTSEDKAYEPLVKELSVNYLSAWARGDIKKMRSLWFDWPNLTRWKHEDGLSMQIQQIDIAKTAWNTYHASYSAKVTYKFGIIGYSMTVKGGMPLIKERDNWKVQGNQMIFDF